MDPFTIGLIISAVATLAGSAVSAKAQYESGKQAAQIAEINAKQAEKDAAEARRARIDAQGEEKKNSARRLAAMQARASKGGLMTSGTVAFGLVHQAETDEYNILARDREAEIGIQDSKYEAYMLRYQGDADEQAGRIGAATTAIKGIGQVAGMGASYGLAMGAKTPAGPVKDSSFLNSLDLKSGTKLDAKTFQTDPLDGYLNNGILG